MVCGSAVRLAKVGGAACDRRPLAKVLAAYEGWRCGGESRRGLVILDYAEVI